MKKILTIITAAALAGTGLWLTRAQFTATATATDDHLALAEGMSSATALAAKHDRSLGPWTGETVFPNGITVRKFERGYIVFVNDQLAHVDKSGPWVDGQ